MLEQITSLDRRNTVYDAHRDRRIDGCRSDERPAAPGRGTRRMRRRCWMSRRRWYRGLTQARAAAGAKFQARWVGNHGIDTRGEVVRDRRTGRTEPQTAGRRTGSRIDPVGVLRKVEVYKSPTAWSTDQKEAGRGAKKVRPSEINHGNIMPTVEPLGVTCAYAEHRAVLTLAGLRRLRFGGGARDTTGRTLLAALALLAIVEQDAYGYALRSRCDLVCDGAAPLELVHADGTTAVVEVDRGEARELYREAYEAALQAGFAFESIVLQPQQKLIDIIRRSRELALEGEGRDERD